MGPVEQEVRDDVEALGDLEGFEPSLAAMCYSLAKAMDSPLTEDRSLSNIAKELRATLTQLFEGRADEDNGIDLDATG